MVFTYITDLNALTVFGICFRRITILQYFTSWLIVLCLVLSAPLRAQPVRNTVGRIMPMDAAALDKQVFRYLVVEPITLDANIANYKAQSGMLPFEGLTLINSNQELLPAAADRWEVSEDELKWTFYLREGARWSDGRPVTAHDFEYTYKRGLDPKNGNVYAFMNYPIKGAEAFNIGEASDPNTVLVTALDDLTLVIETEVPCPYLPYITTWRGSGAVPRWKVEKYGEKWTEPENIATNSTFVLNRWDIGDSFEFGLNRYYNGPHKAYLERIIGRFIGAESPSGYLAYENDEVDYQALTSMDVASIRNNPVLGRELRLVQAFWTEFIFFDTTKPPFNNLKVRQAISHAIDRDALCRIVLQDTATPAHSMLPPGYPAYVDNQLASIQRYDPVLAKKLLEEAGYPNGRGFARQEFVLGRPHHRLVAEAIQQMLKSTLNIDLNIRLMDYSGYIDAMYQWQLPMSLNGFSSDYYDPSSMLTMVWRSRPKGAGRQPWQHDEFDRLVDEAGREMDQDKRLGMYVDAQRILSEDVGGVFLFYPKQAYLGKPWLKGIKENPLGEYPFWNHIDIYIGDNKP
ncbi:MAG TPA: hypothetical protein DIT99_25825 [Candidatus Latescibacteria bacterium]|nr:hypothetical protein [Candidatus Latescibacterota bacterium]